MDDIREIEKETAEMLRKTMAAANGEGGVPGGIPGGENGGMAASDDGEYKPGFDLESNQPEFDPCANSNNNAKAQFSSIGKIATFLID